MIKTKMLIIVQSVLLCLLTSLLNAGMSSTSYKIPTTVMSSGGNEMSSANFSMVSTLGQPTALGHGSSGNYTIESGFFYTLILTIALGDVNGDGVVNLADVIEVLQVATGQTVESIFLEADIDGDGQIGLVEAIMALRKVGGLAD